MNLKIKHFIIRQKILFNIFFGNQVKHIKSIILNTSFEEDGLTKIINDYYVLYSFFEFLNEEHYSDIDNCVQRILEYTLNAELEYAKIGIDSLIIRYKR